jgi:hypothetical protein
MYIESSNILMSSSHLYREKYSRQEELIVWRGNRQTAPGAAAPEVENVRVPEKTAVTPYPERDAGLGPKETDLDKIKDQALVPGSKLFVIKLLLEKLTGKKIKLLKVEDLKPQFNGNPHEIKPEQGKGGDGAPPAHGWGVVYNLHETYHEREAMSFTAGGVVRTKDGREINFLLGLIMSREFMATRDFSFRAGDAAKIDPLVINFNGAAAELTDMKFTFDLDGDGAPDNISFVGPGAGFLALDLNGDGRINDGRELFGPNTGNGFAELAAYDIDGNNWIDEADPVFNRLLIWSKDVQGNDSLTSLREKGIGAIYLNHVSSPFSLTDHANVAQGEIKSTGVYLMENGEVGLVQELDLVV